MPILAALVLLTSPWPGQRATRSTPRPSTVSDALLVIPDVAGRVVRVRDVDGDGAHDLVVPRGPHAGAVRAFDLVSGRTGASIRRLAEFCGRACAPEAWDADGDVDGDGATDLALGFPMHAGERGLVRVVSGRTGLDLHALPGDRARGRFGESLAFLGDLDGDGRDEVAIGAPGSFLSRNPSAHSQAPRATWSVHVVAGEDAHELWRFGQENDARLAAFVAVVGDLDADGRDDLAVSSLSASPLLLSGATGRTIAAPAIFPGPVSGVGDVNGDGVPDLVHDRFERHRRTGLVTLLSGRGCARIAQHQYPDIFPDSGGGPSGVGDVDGDGVPDVAIGDTNFGLPAEVADVCALSLEEAVRLVSAPASVSVESGCAIVRSGRTGKVVHGVWAPREPRIGLGQDVARGPDVDGDGWEDLLVNDGSRCFAFRVERAQL